MRWAFMPDLITAGDNHHYVGGDNFANISNIAVYGVSRRLIKVPGGVEMEGGEGGKS